MQAQKIIAGPLREVFAFAGNSLTSENVCCRLIASENQNRPRSMDPKM